MKTISSIALSLGAAILFTACGGTKNSTAAVAASAGEFDPSTGTWQPLTKVVTPPPPQGGAVIVEQKKPGMMKKMGDTLKKPLGWVGLGKDEAAVSPAPAAAPAAATAKPPTKAAIPPPPQGDAAVAEEKKPGMMKKVGDTLKKPLRWVGLGKDEAAADAASPAATAKPAAKP